MRAIGTLAHENQARRLTAYLKRIGIETTCEPSFDAQTGHMSYQIWVHEEDRIAEAAAIFDRFQIDPMQPEYDLPPEIPTPEEKNSAAENRRASRSMERHQFSPRLTALFISLCSLFFFLQAIQEIPLREEGLSEQTFSITPIQALLLYDLPPAIGELEAVIEKNRIAPDQKLEDLPPAVKAELEAVENAPFWRGFYEWAVLKIKKQDASIALGPLFGKIRQGELWRLFSPCLLHQNLLHLLFNMIWLWVLGKPIEQRIGLVRALLLTLACGIGSNTLQYLMSGPFFIGYSGVAMGLAGFIWMRERKASWEGYPLNRATVLFLLLFVGSIFALQLVSFFLQIFTDLEFAPNIANTAHIGGAAIGAFLGKMHFFAQRVKR